MASTANLAKRTMALRIAYWVDLAPRFLRGGDAWSPALKTLHLSLPV